MTTTDKDISRHYTVADLESRILAALEAAGKDVDALTVDDLAPVDAFHLRGRAATEQLAAWADIRAGHLVLDVGSGVGGTCRYLAATTGCKVIGLDLVESYCRVAERLSARVGLAEHTTFRQGSALELPFTDGHFDVVWTEHVQMNIADKAGFYGELHRVIKPGGQLAFHDIFAGPTEGSLHYPVPWAGDASISYLIGESDLRDLLSRQGLEPVRWADTTEESAGFIQTLIDRLRNDRWPAVGMHLLMGDDAEVKFANMRRNLAEGRLQVVQALLKHAM
jgi:SAM-dependent methyltransferase